MDQPVILSPPEQRWYCPRCGVRDVTHEAKPHTRMHSCRALALLQIPMLPAGVKADIRPREREDYINGDDVQTDAEGRPIMSVEVHRDDGMDAVVYAPCATARMVDVS